MGENHTALYIEHCCIKTEQYMMGISVPAAKEREKSEVIKRAISQCISRASSGGRCVSCSRTSPRRAPDMR